MLNEIQALGTPAPHLGHHDWSLILPEKEIYGACSDQSQCPSNSKCRPSSCDGFLCLCNPGYIASLDRTRCMKGNFISITFYILQKIPNIRPRPKISISEGFKPLRRQARLQSESTVLNKFSCFFSEKVSQCDFSAREGIHTKYQTLFSSKDKSKKSYQLQFY